MARFWLEWGAIQSEKDLLAFTDLKKVIVYVGGGGGGDSGGVRVTSQDR